MISFKKDKYGMFKDIRANFYFMLLKTSIYICVFWLGMFLILLKYNNTVGVIDNITLVLCINVIIIFHVCLW